jgi:hypothetical protein
MNCSQCGAELQDGATSCAACGAEISLAFASASGAEPPPDAPSSAPPPGVSAARPAGSLPPFRFSASRWSQLDRIVGGATLVLFISLFLPWFGVNASIYSVTVDGLWHGYEYIALIVSLALLFYLIARAGWEQLPIKLPVSDTVLLLGATALNLLLVVIGFLDKPGGYTNGVGWRYGAFVALIAAIIAAAPLGLPAIRSRRQKR